MISNILKRTDVRMVQLGNGLGLARETLFPLTALGGMLRKDLDGDRAVKAGISRFVDLTHAARTDRRDDFVMAETFACFESHGTPTAATIFSRSVSMKTDRAALGGFSFPKRAMTSSRLGII